MTDMFGEWVPDEWIAACFGVMAGTPYHTHQVLTKRAKRMREWFAWMADRTCHGAYDPAAITRRAMMLTEDTGGPRYVELGMGALERWPLKNVWLGISAEDQRRADERIPHLLETPAAVRFVSAEPLLGPVTFSLEWLAPFKDTDPALRRTPRIDWVIVGGESGPGARKCEVDWIRSIVKQCRDASVACFVKQLGSGQYQLHTSAGRGRHLYDGKNVSIITDRKGDDPAEWPEDVRVREWPEVTP